MCVVIARQPVRDVANPSRTLAEGTRSCRRTSQAKPDGTDPIVPEWVVNRMIRGGCWLKEAADSRLATRSFRAQLASQSNNFGIRTVRNRWPVGVSKPAIINPEIDGPNVTDLTYQGSAIEQPSVQTGPKSWTTGEIAYSEVSRDVFSVFLEPISGMDRARMGVDHG